MRGDRPVDLGVAVLHMAMFSALAGVGLPFVAWVKRAACFGSPWPEPKNRQ
ncbi:hypothetical protein [Ralstonia syzygii]|uniref:hypothetical protein n=1 Tax=Ralstonia syzygii TaxID=28097 RepID=UPI0018D1BB39|nr:hypothetical protein [Ralstonia syzygii]